MKRKSHVCSRKSSGVLLLMSSALCALIVAMSPVLMLGVEPTPKPVVAPLLVGGPDTFGYTFTDSNEPGGPAFNFEDISGTGTAIPPCDDCMFGPFPIGFNFSYYGSIYTNIFISTNGFLSVLPGQFNGCCNGQPIPSAGNPDGIIAGWWTDLLPAGAGRGTVYYETRGASPNRRFIVHYSNTWYFARPIVVNFEIKLFENSGVIEVHYERMPSDTFHTNSAGIENQNGTVGLQYHRGVAGLNTPLAVRYSRNRPPDCSAVAPNPSTLWPPDHRLVRVTISGATDPDGDRVTVSIVGVGQNEPVNGTGDGDTAPDAVLSGGNAVQLRAERAANGQGRVYSVLYMASDGSLSCSGRALVEVPHDRGNRARAADDTPIYNSLLPN